MKYAILAVLFLAVTACFGQTDSLDMLAKTKITTRTKPVDTVIMFDEVYENLSVRSGKKAEVYAKSDLVKISRVFQATDRTLADGSILSMDSISVQLVARVTKIYGAKINGKAIVPGDDIVVVKTEAVTVVKPK